MHSDDLMTENGVRTPDAKLVRAGFVRDQLRKGDEVVLDWNASLGVPRYLSGSWLTVTSTARPTGRRIAVRDGAFERLVSMYAVRRIRRLEARS